MPKKQKHIKALFNQLGIKDRKELLKQLEAEKNNPDNIMQLLKNATEKQQNLIALQHQKIKEHENLDSTLKQLKEHIETLLKNKSITL